MDNPPRECSACSAFVVPLGQSHSEYGLCTARAPTLRGPVPGHVYALDPMWDPLSSDDPREGIWPFVRDEWVCREFEPRDPDAAEGWIGRRYRK